MTAVADWHAERGGSLVAALGEAAVARLMLRFAGELETLAEAARAEAAPALAQRLHRVAGAAASLGLDSAAAVLADAEGQDRAAVVAAVAAAELGRQRGWAALLAAHPGVAAHARGAWKE